MSAPADTQVVGEKIMDDTKPHSDPESGSRTGAVELSSDPVESGSKFYNFYRSAWAQTILVSFCAFCLPGFYNALSGIGGSGQLDPTVGANASVALLSVGAATGLLVAQPVFDLMGIRTIVLGGWTYALYSASLLCYNHTHRGAFVIASGAILGLGASFFWVTQGAIMLSYPLPNRKGLSIMIFWIIFNFGGMIGSFISLGLNFHRLKAGTVNDGTYAAMMVVMFVGWILSFFLLPAHKVIRSNGTHVAPLRHGEDKAPEHWWQNFTQTAKREFWHMVKLKDEPRILWLLPLCFAANWFYSYQQNIVNGKSFSLRARSLNSALYWGAQMFGGSAIGLICDFVPASRPKRALIAWCFVFVMGNVIMGGGLAYQNVFEVHEKAAELNWIDFADSKVYVGPAFLYIFYGMLDAFWQGFAYWLLGSLCNTPKEAARFVGVYKSMQCVGGAVAYRLTANHLASRKQFISNWVIIAAALVFALPAVLKVTEPTDMEKRGEFLSDEDDAPGAKHKIAADEHLHQVQSAHQ